MSSSNIPEVPEFAEKVIENVLDEPAKAIGTTFADIWFLVLGGYLGHLTEKRKVKYALYLQKYREEIEKKLSDIPLDKREEADIQTVGNALEASKYCLENERVREMFASLITASMHSEKKKYARPIYCDILKNMTPLDADVFRIICLMGNFDEPVIWKTEEEFYASLSSLMVLGLIEIRDDSFETAKMILKNNGKIFRIMQYLGYVMESEKMSNDEKKKKEKELRESFDNSILFQTYICGMFCLTPLGKELKEICY